MRNLRLTDWPASIQIRDGPGHGCGPVREHQAAKPQASAMGEAVSIKEPYLIWKDADADGPARPRAISDAALKRIIRFSAGAVALLILMPPIPVLIPWLWIAAMLSGYGAALLIGVLMLLPLRRVVFARWGRISVPAHERLAWWCLGLTALHALILIVCDPVVIEYLKWHQPRHMIAGNAGFILLALIVVTSLERVRVLLFGLRLRFRPVHVAASLLLLVLAATHMLGSAIYLEGRVKMAVFALMCAALAALALRRPRDPAEAGNSPAD